MIQLLRIIMLAINEASESIKLRRSRVEHETTSKIRKEAITRAVSRGDRDLAALRIKELVLEQKLSISSELLNQKQRRSDEIITGSLLRAQADAISSLIGVPKRDSDFDTLIEISSIVKRQREIMTDRKHRAKFLDLGQFKTSACEEFVKLEVLKHAKAFQLENSKGTSPCE